MLRSSARTPVLRQTIQRRFAHEGPKFEGAADNAFNRERAAVKAHAAGSTGEFYASKIVWIAVLTWNV